MSGGLLSLKWNNHCSTFLQILSTLHKKQTYHDATVACGGALYPVHKIVLSTCSEYFEEMFDSINDKHPIIVLKDIKGEVFEALLKYMYIGEVNVIQDRLNDLINAAECLKIKGLAVPDEDPTEGSSVRPNRSNSSNNNPSISTKRRHEHSDSSNSQPPFKVHKTVKNVANSSKEPKNYREAEKERSLSVNSNEALFHEEDDDVIEEVPIKQEREEYEGEASSSKDKRPTPHLPNTEHKNEQEKESTSAAPEQTEDLSKVEILEEEDCGSNSADQWTGANLGDEDNFSYLGDSNSGAAEDIRPQDETNEGDNNEGVWLVDGKAGGSGMSPVASCRSAPKAAGTRTTPQSVHLVFPDANNRPKDIKLAQFTADNDLRSQIDILMNTPSNGNTFLSPDNERQGYLEQTQCKMFSCSECDYQTYIKHNFDRHWRKHTGDKPFGCPFCPHRCTTKQNVVTHMIFRHTDKDFNRHMVINFNNS